MLSLRTLALSILSALAMIGTAEARLPFMDMKLPITQGHTLIGGSGSFTNIGDDSYSVFRLSPKAEYFILDKISFGGGVELTFAKYSKNESFRFRTLTLFPSGSFYFWADAGMATYVNQTLNVNFNNNSDNTIGGKTGLGISFFLNEFVAVSPELQMVYEEHQSGRLDLLAQITAYL